VWNVLHVFMMALEKHVHYFHLPLVCRAEKNTPTTDVTRDLNNHIRCTFVDFMHMFWKIPTSYLHYASTKKLLLTGPLPFGNFFYFQYVL